MPQILCVKKAIEPNSNSIEKLSRYPAIIKRNRPNNLVPDIDWTKKINAIKLTPTTVQNLVIDDPNAS